MMSARGRSFSCSPNAPWEPPHEGDANIRERLLPTRLTGYSAGLTGSALLCGAEPLLLPSGGSLQWLWPVRASSARLAMPCSSRVCAMRLLQLLVPSRSCTLGSLSLSLVGTLCHLLLNLLLTWLAKCSVPSLPIRRRELVGFACNTCGRLGNLVTSRASSLTLPKWQLLSWLALLLWRLTGKCSPLWVGGRCPHCAGVAPATGLCH